VHFAAAPHLSRRHLRRNAARCRTLAASALPGRESTAPAYFRSPLFQVALTLEETKMIERAETAPLDERYRITVETERATPIGVAQIVEFDWAQPIDRVSSASNALRVDLCLTPRNNARAGFPDRWGPHRFERLGDVFLVAPGQSIRAKSESGRQDSVICEFEPNAVSEWFDGELEWTNRRLEANLDVTSPNVRALMLRLAEEMRHPGFASEAMIELIEAQIAIELSRYCQAVNENAASGGLAPWRLRRIEERLSEQVAPPTLGELAQLCNLSVRQLTRAFRASRGCSIGDYIARSRIEHAKRLLTTDSCVKSIAHTLGFSSPSSFSYAFRCASGETPRQFRQRAYRSGW
jgi:AraC family transcriptional regulator